MRRWARMAASAVTLAGLLLGLVAPAFASCPCAARKAAVMRSCPRCAACGDVAAGVKLTRPSCCSARVATAPSAVNTSALQIEKPQLSGSGAPAVHTRATSSAAAGLASHPLSRGGPPHPSGPAQPLVNFLRL